MFSFKRRIKELEELDARTREAVANYQALVELLSKVVLPATTAASDPTQAAAFCEKMEAVAKQLAENPEQLSALHPQVLAEVDSFEKHRYAYQQAKDLEFQATLALVGKATAGLTGHHAKCMNHVEETKNSFQGVMHLRNLMEVRQRISQELERLNEGIERLQSEAEETIGSLRSELDRFRHSGDEDDDEEEKRWVTGVALREPGEQILMETIAARMNFALLDFKMDDVQWVERAYGELCAERVIRQFANALRKSFRRTDTIVRWDRDEFVVLLPGANEETSKRIAEHTARSVNTRYRVVAIGKIFEVGVSSGYSAVEWRPPKPTDPTPAEGVESLLRRARRANSQWQKHPDFEEITKEPDL